MNIYEKTSKGFTLLEALVALSIWMIVSLSIVLIWQHTSRHSHALINRQDAFENARVTMDALLVNTQLAYRIVLRVEGDFILQNARLYQIDTGGSLHPYEIIFNYRLRPGTEWHHRLRTGGQEFAHNIARVQMRPIGTQPDWRRMEITVTTGCEYAITLEGSVCIRNKHVSVTRVVR